jgi:EGF-like domain
VALAALTSEQDASTATVHLRSSRPYRRYLFCFAVEAHCPNACSGHGTCQTKDQCVCDPGWIGNDCSLRTCPVELSFADTQRGDLNHDGVVSLSSDGGLVNTQWSVLQEYEQFPPVAWTTVQNVLVHSDAPVSADNGEAHFYAECSGKGSCNRATGECECAVGYTGAACQRSEFGYSTAAEGQRFPRLSFSFSRHFQFAAACPNDCSGKGVCRTLREIAGLQLNKKQYASMGGHKLMSGVQSAFDYTMWDADKATACVCDAGYGGFDCSQRACPRGDDPLTNGKRWCGGEDCTYEVQAFTVSDSPSTTYRFGYTDSFNGTSYTYVTLDVSATANGYVAPKDQSTLASGPLTTAGILQSALRGMLTGALQRIEVYPHGNATATPGADSTRTFLVTFVGVGGKVAPLTIEPAYGPGQLWYNPFHPSYNAAVPDESSRRVVTVKAGNYEEIECSGRGNCDTDTGICSCAAGYSGESCQNQNVLVN